MHPNSRKEFVVAIICALPLEADAVGALFEEVYDPFGLKYGKGPGDRNAYALGRIGCHNVVLCHLANEGNISAATTTSDLMSSYKGIQLVLNVGVCGATPYNLSGSPIFLGDVIIGDSIVDYDHNIRYSPEGSQGNTNPGITSGPDRILESLLTGLKNEPGFQVRTVQQLLRAQQSGARWRLPQSDDVLFEASYQHSHRDRKDPSAECPCVKVGSVEPCLDAVDSSCKSLGCRNDRVQRRRSPTETMRASVHIGTIACASTVMRSAEHRDHWMKKEGVIGFDMETVGILNCVPCMTIKGVCDYADSHKAKEWQPYAAATGAAAAKAFLESWRPVFGPRRQL